MKKRLLSVLLSAVMIGTIAGTAMPVMADDKEDIRVAGVVYLEDQFMKLMLAGYEAAADEAGVDYVYGNCSNDQAKETELINSYVAQNINGIAIAPLSEKSSVASLKAASEKGVKIALTDGTLENSDFITVGYTSDQYQLGQSTGEAAKKFIEDELGGEAKIAVVQFKSLLPEKSSQRVNGFLDVVEKLDGVEVGADQDAWVQDDAVSVVSDILTANPDVNLIYAANEDGTLCSVLVIDQDDNYVSFVGEGTFDEENGTVTITDEVSEMALTCGVAVKDDDTLTLDMGDLGSATVEEATLAVAVQGLKYAVENGTEMN